MNPWLQSWEWADVAVALLVWVIVLAVLSWLLTNFTTRPPRHY